MESKLSVMERVKRDEGAGGSSGGEDVISITTITTTIILIAIIIIRDKKNLRNSEYSVSAFLAG